MERTRFSKTKKIALTALFAAFAAALGYIDAILPVLNFLPLPGIKLGLANFAVLFALYRLGWQYAAAVSVVRVLLVNLLLFPSFTSLWFSLAGAALSFCVMLLLQRLSFHRITVSVAGAVAHNLAQLAAAALLLESVQVFSYFTVLLPVGIVTGALLGLLIALIEPRIGQNSAETAAETQSAAGRSDGRREDQDDD